MAHTDRSYHPRSYHMVFGSYWSTSSAVSVGCCRCPQLVDGAPVIRTVFSVQQQSTDMSSRYTGDARDVRRELDAHHHLCTRGRISQRQNGSTQQPESPAALQQTKPRSIDMRTNACHGSSASCERGIWWHSQAAAKHRSSSSKSTPLAAVVRGQHVCVHRVLIAAVVGSGVQRARSGDLIVLDGNKEKAWLAFLHATLRASSPFDPYLLGC